MPTTIITDFLLRRSATALTLIATAVFGLIASAPRANAVSVLLLDDRDTAGFDVQVADNSALDLNPALGIVTFQGAVGAYVNTLATLISLPVIGQGGRPALDLSLVTATPFGLNTSGIDVIGTSTGLLVGPGLTNISGLFETGGTTTGRIVQTQAAINSNNVPFGPYGPLAGAPGSQTITGGCFVQRVFPTDSGAFSCSRSTTVSVQDSLPFSLSARARVIHDNPGDVTSLNIYAAVVPVPAALPLMASALAALWWRTRRRQPV